MDQFKFYLRLIITILAIIWISKSILKIVEAEFIAAPQVEILNVKQAAFQYIIYSPDSPILEITTKLPNPNFDIYLIEGYALETITPEDLKAVVLLGCLENQASKFSLHRFQVSEPSTLIIYNANTSKTVAILNFKI